MADQMLGLQKCVTGVDQQKLNARQAATYTVIVHIVILYSQIPLPESSVVSLSALEHAAVHNCLIKPVLPLPVCVLLRNIIQILVNPY